MLFHHGSQPYEVAAGDAANRAKDKLNEMIDMGRLSGRRIIERIMTEVPTDQIVKSKALHFDGFEGERNRLEEQMGLTMGFTQHPGPDQEGKEYKYGIHDHALQQLCAKYNLPIKYARFLSSPENRGKWLPLLARNLNELTTDDPRRVMLRSLDNEVRGVVSDRYKRLDSRLLVESFSAAAAEVGAVPVEGLGTDTKVALKALIPRVYEPAPNEVMAFGVMWENSDYADGAHALRGFCLRLWCTNYAIADEGLREVHLGKRLSENMTFSERTYELDSKATASALQDVVKNVLDQDRVTAFCNMIKKAHAEEVDVKSAIRKFRKDISKGELEQITNAFNSPDVLNLPPGNTLWRLSNAVSWIAGQEENDGRRIELQKVAGSVLPKAA